MKLGLWIMISLVACTVGRNYYFYADVRWEQVDYYSTVLIEHDIPYNHGLRIMPGIWAARKMISEGLRIWSRSPTVKDSVVNNRFYQSNAEYVAVCKGIDGSQSASNCFLNSNYDIGFCAPSALEPIRDASTVSTLHCKNNPPKGHIFSFMDQNNTYSTSIPLLKPGEFIEIILPNGRGLDSENRKKFKEKFGGFSRSKHTSLGDLNERIKFVADACGDEFAGIIGSTENAYYTAIIAKSLKVPNLVPAVSDSEGNP